jgi:hypothetical protein
MAGGENSRFPDGSSIWETEIDVIDVGPHNSVIGLIDSLGPRLDAERWNDGRGGHLLGAQACRLQEIWLQEWRLRLRSSRHAAVATQLSTRACL